MLDSAEQREVVIRHQRHIDLDATHVTVTAIAAVRGAVDEVARDLGGCVNSQSKFRGAQQTQTRREMNQTIHCSLPIILCDFHIHAFKERGTDQTDNRAQTIYRAEDQLEIRTMLFKSHGGSVSRKERRPDSEQTEQFVHVYAQDAKDLPFGDSPHITYCPENGMRRLQMSP